MLFNSFEFLIFFPIVTFLFYLLPDNFRWIMLVIASCIFYCYFIPAYLLILLLIILIDYTAAIQIEKSGRKKTWMFCSIFANIGLLAVFKYYNFFAENINKITGTNLALLNIVLPIGLSFHTFQALSYTIDVYKGKWHAEKHLGLYALYVLFYPQLVAGPIERPQNMFPRFRSKIIFDPKNLVDGLRLIIWGFFKKLVIADRLSLYVNIVYNHPDKYNSINVFLAIIFFSLQIYCDFSGYSDIARGAARCMGYNLMVNFRRPFFAKNIREFWHRWHVSLSTWFRDYVYFPMGGSYGTKFHTVTVILVVFLLSGMWHGAGWNFIIWGLLHAVFLIVAFLFFKNIDFKFKFPGILLTNLLVAYAFVFFRTSSPAHAIKIISSSLSFINNIPFQFGIQSFFGETGIGNSTMIILLCCICFLFYYEYKTNPSLDEMNKHPGMDIGWFVFMTLSIIFFGVFTKETFIYFQF